jgi:hypothetical protein
MLNIDFEKMLESVGIACVTFGVASTVFFIIMIVGNADYGTH